VSRSGFVDISNVSKQKDCVCEEEDLEVDFGLTDTTQYTGKPWDEGRVVVDLHVLFNALTCQQCSLPLDPTKCMGLHPDGICGYAYIICSNPACNHGNRVPLGKTHRNAVKGPPIYDVNSKLPLG
jgi:hypothetical protein